MIAFGSIVGEIAGANYNALLVSVSTPRTVGRVSGLGWGFGYLGGIVALTIVVGLILGGVLDGTQPLTFQLIAAGATVWTLLFTIPIFRYVPEPPPAPEAKRVNFFAGYVELVRSIIRLWREHRPTFWFLLASAVYRDGLAAVFTFGSVIAARVFGFGFTDLVIFGIALNLVAGVSTIVAGRLDDRFGPKAVILAALGGIIACCLTVFFGAGPGKGLFWVAGIVLAAWVGPARRHRDRSSPRSRRPVTRARCSASTRPPGGRRAGSHRSCGGPSSPRRRTRRSTASSRSRSFSPWDSCCSSS